ncbi:MAG: hypothetical protein AAGA83_18220 [Cyanobacteria bacterium P01_F01_bin.116]
MTPLTTILGIRSVIDEILSYEGPKADSEAIDVSTTLDQDFKVELWRWLRDYDPILQSRLITAKKRIKTREEQNAA